MSVTPLRSPVAVRNATPDDISSVVEIGRKFTTAAGLAFDEEALRGSLDALIAGDEGILLITEDGTGVIGGLVFRQVFSEERCAQELFWWADGGGLDLLSAFERAAKEKGASSVVMVCLEALTPDRVERIYRRRGYKPLERCFVRAL